MELALRRNRKRFPTISTPEMDRRIWRKLPVELLERVLSCLPLKTFLGLRSTCKYFNSLIFSPIFLAKHANSLPPPLSSFLLLSHPQSGHYLLYDTVLNTWRDIRLPLTDALTFTPLLCTATCVLCFSAVPDSSNSAFLIYNLLGGSTRTVKFPEYPFAFQFPTLITDSTGYHLFCLSSSASSSQAYAYVYDSRVRKWTRYNGFKRNLADSNHLKGVFLNGSLYFATRLPYLVVGFDLHTGKWETLNVDLPEDLTFVRLAVGNRNGEGEKKLFMIGGIGSTGISKSMKVWELDAKGRKWMEIESVPEMMCRKLGSVSYHNYDNIYCFWHQGMICLCCYTWPEVLYYKVSRKTWHWLPKSPSLPDRWSCGFQWYSFVPELYPFV